MGTNLQPALVVARRVGWGPGGIQWIGVFGLPIYDCRLPMFEQGPYAMAFAVIDWKSQGKKVENG